MQGKVIRTKRVAKGIYGFINAGEAEDYYFDSRGVLGGIELRYGDEVEFDAVKSFNGKMRAVNVKLAGNAKAYSRMEAERLSQLSGILREELADSGFIDSNSLPDVFRKAGIEYRQYADNLRSFQEQYLRDFILVPNATIGGTVYPMVLMTVARRLEAVSEETRRAIQKELERGLDEKGYLKPGEVTDAIQNAGIASVREYAPDLAAFLSGCFPGKYTCKRRVEINGTINLILYVRSADADRFQEDKLEPEQDERETLDQSVIEKLRSRLSQETAVQGHLEEEQILGILKEAGIDGESKLKGGIEGFVGTYLSGRLEVRRETAADRETGKRIVVLRDAAAPYAGLRDLYRSGDCKGVLRSRAMRFGNPNALGLQGIELVLKALAQYLQEDPEQCECNAFQSLLITEPSSSGLKRFKNDEQLLWAGAKTAVPPTDAFQFSKVFGEIANGRRTYNTKWEDLLNRFWTAQNRLAPYLTALWLIVSQTDEGIYLFIDEAFKRKDLSKLPLILKVYADFVFGGKNGVSVRLQKKIIGNCLDCGDMQTLLRAYPYFDRSLPELPGIVRWLSGEAGLTAKQMLSWYHGEIGALIAEKFTNYYWWKESRNGVTEDLIRVLTAVLCEFPTSYYTEIIYNASCPQFNGTVKEMILAAHFDDICRCVRDGFADAYVLANYVYANCLAMRRDESTDAAWAAMREQMKSTVKARFTEDVLSACSIQLFRFDRETAGELEQYYCSTFAAGVLETMRSDEELDAYLSKCEENHLTFIAQWAAVHRSQPELLDRGRRLNSLLAAKMFTDALLFLQRDETYSSQEKRKYARDTLCQFFEEHMLDEAAYHALESAVGPETAEKALLQGLNFIDEAAVSSLIQVYTCQKKWVYAIYLFVPFKHFSVRSRRFLDDYSAFLRRNGFDLTKLDSHYDVIRVALQVYDPDAFDAFLQWAQRIPIPYNSRLYAPKPRIFDANFQEMLAGGDYREQWKQLALTALLTDNRDRPDNIRFCIVASYIGRNGPASFEELVHAASLQTDRPRSYSALFASLWKGILDGDYSVNFLRLSRLLVDAAPITFWNYYYEVTVCRNKAFSRKTFGFMEYTEADHQKQAFYDMLLEKYTSTRKPVYADIALNLLWSSPEVTVPHLESYIPFCANGDNRAVMLTALVQLVCQNRFVDQIAAFAGQRYSSWSVPQEHMLRALSALCARDMSYFLEDEDDFSEDEIGQICSDYLECVKDYPSVRMLRSVSERIGTVSRAYEYRLAELILRVRDEGKVNDAYMKKLLRTLPEGEDPRQRAADTKYYLKFAMELYRHDLCPDVKDIMFIKNRYLRILTASVYLSEDRGAFQDDEIVLLMQRRHHFTGLYPEYKAFRTLLLDFVRPDRIREEQIEAFALGFVSNDWRLFTGMLTTYGRDLLECIQKMESCTNFRNFNYHFIKGYLLDGAFRDDASLSAIAICSPMAGGLLRDIRRIEEQCPEDLAACREILSGVCRLNNFEKPMQTYRYLERSLKNTPGQLQKHWDLYMKALLATSYPKTLVNSLADEVRKNKKDLRSVLAWKPIFAELQEISVFYYLLAVFHAVSKNRTEAKNAYAMIADLNEIPPEWRAEQADLNAYLTGEKATFYPAKWVMSETYAYEKEAADVRFIERYHAEKGMQAARLNPESVANAYKTVSRPGVEESRRFAGYQQLFSQLKRPEDLYGIWQQPSNRGAEGESGRLTYNEMVIEYGSMIITLDDSLPRDEKCEILLEIFDVYGLLNENNRERKNVVQCLSAAAQAVLETPGVTFETWIANREQIRGVLQQPVLEYSSAEIADWEKPVEECARICAGARSETELLRELESWRSLRVLSASASNLENAFHKAADEKIEALRNGINLSAEINNTVLDDGCVFYQVTNVSPVKNVSARLGNAGADAVRLRAELAVNGGPPVRYEGAKFSSELILRPGDSCGQCWRLPAGIAEPLKDGDAVQVSISMVYGAKVICDAHAELRAGGGGETLRPDMLTARSHYLTTLPAFSPTIRGFGREREKAALRDLMDGNLAVIYGPSRVGKSSLLNYLSNEYFDEYCAMSGRSSVLQIRICDEQISRHDYTRSMLTDEPLQFEDASALMAYLFEAPLRLAFSEKKSIRARQMCRTSAPLPEEARREIAEVLSEKADITGKYSEISRILSAYNCELWLLYDEFQQVVERWTGNADALAEFCTMIRYSQPGNSARKSIKIVFCGSDALVRIFECVRDDSWDEFKIKTADTWVFVGQLSGGDFASMMDDRSVWTKLPDAMPWNIGPADGTGRRELPAVLQSLYDYTGGNAISGKIFGEELIRKIRDGVFAGRRYFYPADITQVTYELLSAEASKLKNLLRTHTTRNLQKEEPYLLFLASELAADTDRPDVPLKRILEFFHSRDSRDIETALKVLTARGIIQTAADGQRYRFATLFYFDFYRDMATDTAMQRLREAEEQGQAEARDRARSWVDSVVEIVTSQPVVDRYDISKIIDSRHDDDLKAGIGEIYGKGTTIQAGTYIGENIGTSIGTMNNVQINAQTISTAFNTLLDGSASGEKLLEAFQSLPTVGAYLPEAQRLSLPGRRAQLLESYKAYDACFTAGGNCVDPDRAAEMETRIAEAEQELEQLSDSAEKQLLRDTMGAVSVSEDALNVSEKRWRELLGVGLEQVKQLRKLPAEIATPLSFAVVLHNMFAKLYEEILRRQGDGDLAGAELAPDKLDFCPVAILYCKVVEALLKKAHTPLYIRHLGNKALKPGSPSVFKDLDNPARADAAHKDLTIGSFSSHLVYLPRGCIEIGQKIRRPKETDFQFGTRFFRGDEENYLGNIQKLAGENDADDDTVDLWKEHACALRVVQEIRNKSAHEAIPISKDAFDWLIEVLFEDGELLRIWDLSR